MLFNDIFFTSSCISLKKSVLKGPLIAIYVLFLFLELVTGDLFSAERYYCTMDLEKFRTNFTNSLDKLPLEISKEMLQARPYVIDRIDGRTLTELEFFERFEKPKIPAIFTHLIDDWPAYQAVYCSVILRII